MAPSLRDAHAEALRKIHSCATRAGSGHGTQRCVCNAARALSALAHARRPTDERTGACTWVNTSQAECTRVRLRRSARLPEHKRTRGATHSCLYARTHGFRARAHVP
eukprot:353067-Chlamydomonas_euryale.AAC.5